MTERKYQETTKNASILCSVTILSIVRIFSDYTAQNMNNELYLYAALYRSPLFQIDIPKVNNHQPTRYVAALTHIRSTSSPHKGTTYRRGMFT